MPDLLKQLISLLADYGGAFSGDLRSIPLNQWLVILFSFRHKSVKRLYNPFKNFLDSCVNARQATPDCPFVRIIIHRVFICSKSFYFGLECFDLPPDTCDIPVYVSYQNFSINFPSRLTASIISSLAIKSLLSKNRRSKS